MAKQFFLKKYPVLLLSILILLTGFTNKNPYKSTASKLTIAYSTTGVPADGELNILWAESSAFKNLRKGKTVFKFRFWLNDSITLHGWHASGPLRNIYKNPTSDIQLFSSTVIDTTYKPGTYFGNVILYGPDLKKIKKRIRTTGSKYVLFIPIIKEEQIEYSIFLADKVPPDKSALAAATDTKASANPSPPRKYVQSKSL